MGLSIERNNYAKIQDLGFDFVNDLVLNGAFTVVAVDKVETTAYSRINSHFVLKPTTLVDPLAGDADQPWRLVVEFSDAEESINVWAVTPLQVDDVFDVAQTDTFAEAGRLSPENTTQAVNPKSSFFMRQSSKNSLWSCYKVNAFDGEALPLSYHLTWTDHGIFFSMWAESFDGAGDCFNWFLIQRPVDCQTGQIIVHGKAPLVCMFSQVGNNSSFNLNNISSISESILYFIVRENDISMPTVCVSACVPTADSLPMINPIQQVSLMESGEFVTRFPQGFCTARHVYDYKLDMVAYTSADVLSQWSKPSFTLFGESQPRRYKALNANFPNNTGMRILVQDSGKGI